MRKVIPLRRIQRGGRGEKPSKERKFGGEGDMRAEIRALMGDP